MNHADYDYFIFCDFIINRIIPVEKRSQSEGKFVPFGAQFGMFKERLAFFFKLLNEAISGLR